MTYCRSSTLSNPTSSRGSGAGFRVPERADMPRHSPTWTAYAPGHGYSPSTSPKPSPLRAPRRGISGTDSADLSVLPFSSPLDLRVVEQEDYVASKYQPVPAVFRAAVWEYRGRLPHVFVNRCMAYAEQFSCRHHRIQQIGDYPVKIRAHGFSPHFPSPPAGGMRL